MKDSKLTPSLLARYALACITRAQASAFMTQVRALPETDGNESRGIYFVIVPLLVTLPGWHNWLARETFIDFRRDLKAVSSSLTSGVVIFLLVFFASPFVA